MNGGLLGASDYCLGCNLSKFMGLTCCTVEFDVAYLKIHSFLKNSCSNLEEGHQSGILNKAEVDPLG